MNGNYDATVHVKCYGFKSPLIQIKKVFNFMNGSLQLKVQQDMGSVNIDSAGMFEKTTILVVQYTLRKKDDNITKLRKSGRGGGEGHFICAISFLIFFTYRYMQKSRDVYTSRDHEMFQNLRFLKNIASYILLHYKYSLQSGWKVKVPKSFLFVLRLFVNIKTVKNKSYLNF